MVETFSHMNSLINIVYYLKNNGSILTYPAFRISQVREENSPIQFVACGDINEIPQKNFLEKQLFVEYLFEIR